MSHNLRTVTADINDYAQVAGCNGGYVPGGEHVLFAVCSNQMSRNAVPLCRLRLSSPAACLHEVHSGLAEYRRDENRMLAL